MNENVKNIYVCLLKLGLRVHSVKRYGNVLKITMISGDYRPYMEARSVLTPRRDNKDE